MLQEMQNNLAMPDATTVELRDYQERDVDSIMKSLNIWGRTMYQLHTGGGKTTIALEVIRRMLVANPNVPVVWVVHRKELIKQVYERAMEMGIPTNNSYLASAYYAGYLNVQSVGKLKNNPIPSDSRLVIDEAHHAFAAGYARAIRRQTGWVLGITATPWRMSKKEGFDHLFWDLVVGESLTDLVNNGHLIKPNIFVPDGNGRIEIIDPPMDRFGEYKVQEMFERDRASFIKIPINAVINVLRRKPDARILVYAVNQEAGFQIAETVAMAWFAGDFGKVGLLLSNEDLIDRAHEKIETDRPTLIERFRTGETQVVVNVTIATEGLDIPGADVAILGRPSKSLALIRQMIGRVMRPASGKDEADVYDLNGNVLDPDIGWPWNEYPWSLKPRGDNVAGDMILKQCMNAIGQSILDDSGCGAIAHPAQHECSACHLSYGMVCNNCNTFRHWKDWETYHYKGTVTDYYRGITIESDPQQCFKCQTDNINIEKQNIDARQRKEREEQHARWLAKEEEKRQTRRNERIAERARLDQEEADRISERKAREEAERAERIERAKNRGRFLNPNTWRRLEESYGDADYTVQDTKEIAISALAEFYAWNTTLPRDKRIMYFPAEFKGHIGNPGAPSVETRAVETRLGRVSDKEILPLWWGKRWLADEATGSWDEHDVTVVLVGTPQDLVTVVQENAKRKVVNDLGITF